MRVWYWWKGWPSKFISERMLLINKSLWKEPQSRPAMSVNLPSVIMKKRNGHVLNEHEMRYFIKSASTETCDKSQIGAMLMAMFLNGLSDEETDSLTKEIILSGKQMKWDGVVVDKHSTGGVGDKVSIPLAPALAALGLKVPMISGRSLGHTGGTLDKLESIPGFRVNLTEDEMRECLSEVGCFIAATTSDLCPADRVLYKIRDITSTVDHSSLVTGSIMSKKIAEGAKYIVIDLKIGNAAFMKNVEDGEELAKKMIMVSKSFDVKTRVCLTRMDEPIGFSVGNSLEIEESIECLRGNGPEDLLNMVILLGGELVNMCGKASSASEGKEMIKKVIQNGSALKKFKEMLVAQGVSDQVAETLSSGDFSPLPGCVNKLPVLSPKDGWVSSIDAMKLAESCCKLGAGRSRADDIIDPSVGVRLRVTYGQQVSKGQLLMSIYHNSQIPLTVNDAFIESITVSSEKPFVNSRLIKIIS